MKIFISYSHKDSNYVLPIAEELLKIYGKQSVIIDKFSNLPGDSLIGFMNDSLESFTHFIFFISENSVNSYLTSLEWKNALIMCRDPSKKFIPVIVDSVNIPAILKDKIYINLYANGILHAFQEIKDVIDNNGLYITNKNLDNLYTKITFEKECIRLEIGTKFYSEPNSSFCIAFKNGKKIHMIIEESFQGSDEISEFEGEERYLVFIRLFRTVQINIFKFMKFYSHYLKQFKSNRRMNSPLRI